MIITKTSTKLRPKGLFGSDEKILIECDFKIHLKCKGQYYKIYKNVLKTQANNNGKDMCVCCFNSLTKAGSNNFNFKFEKNENFFEKIDSELKAYLLGWIAGDGHIGKDKIMLEIHKCDIEILELFKVAISPNSPIFKSPHPIKGINTVCWKIHSVKMIKDVLKHLNLNKTGKKSHDISFPKISNVLLVHFIRGIIDSDGSISNIGKVSTPNCSYCSMSPKIRKQLMTFCNNLNIKNNELKFTVSTSGVNAINFMNLIYKNSNYSLTRKRAMYKLWTTWIPFQGNAVRPKKIYKHIGSNKNTGVKFTGKRLKKILALNKNKRKLTNKNVKEICNLHKNGISHPKIAIKFKCSRETIWRIVNNKTYKEVKR